MNKIKYDLKNLINISELDIINGKTDNREYYIINNKYYID